MSVFELINKNLVFKNKCSVFELIIKSQYQYFNDPLKIYFFKSKCQYLN